MRENISRRGPLFLGESTKDALFQLVFSGLLLCQAIPTHVANARLESTPSNLLERERTSKLASF